MILDTTAYTEGIIIRAVRNGESENGVQCMYNNKRRRSGIVSHIG